ncbi:hypothetical protein BURK1_02343 [Burkholderiales bacterium]|nr:hypothetical protein BURK1_02343 [Burkholderiales bacterium]
MNPAYPIALCAAAALLSGCERVAALATGTPFASFEARCAALEDGRIDVVRVPSEVTEDYAHDHADLARLAESASPRHRTVGLTRAKFGYRSTLELDGLEDPRGARSCARPRVRIEVAASSMTVYVAREFRGDPCREPLILEHEHRHVDVFERYADEASPALERELDALVGRRVRHGATIAEVQQALSAELTAHLEAFMASARDELAARHAAVDTHEEYGKLARMCGATP